MALFSAVVHRALKMWAAQRNRNTVAEIRAILQAAVRDEGRVRLGTVLSARSQVLGLSNGDVEALARSASLANPYES